MFDSILVCVKHFEYINTKKTQTEKEKVFLEEMNALVFGLKPNGEERAILFRHACLKLALEIANRGNEGLPLDAEEIAFGVAVCEESKKLINNIQGGSTTDGKQGTVGALN